MHTVDKINKLNKNETKTMTNPSSYDERITKIRKLMKLYSLNALIITSKDHYLNEYVDKTSSPRVYLSGFDGTAGDLLITTNEAYLLVDGRYHTQAEKQIDKRLFKIEKVGIDENGERVTEYLSDRLITLIEKLSKGKNYVIGYDPHQMGLKTLEYIKEGIKKATKSTILTPLFKSLESELFIESAKHPASIISVPDKIAGVSVSEKLKILRESLLSMNINAYFISSLDEIAYLTNLRGDEIPFNSTFKALSLVSLKEAFLFVPEEDIKTSAILDLQKYFQIHSLSNMSNVLKTFIDTEQNSFHIAYDTSSISCAFVDVLNQLINKNCKIFELEKNPLKTSKSIKNTAEIKYISRCFKKSDQVFNHTIKWFKESIINKRTISEKDLQNTLENFYTTAGATRQSFAPICATGTNSATIHYTHANYENIIKENDLFLIDSGAYYDYGYATDLTRTILAGNSPTKKQKELYTIVLKASIAGLSAELPPGSNGAYLDKIVRSVITNKGYDYNHGTGHGIGILVHESPPGISYATTGDITLKEGMLFSIEPGIYIENWGGIRIENIVTLQKHSDKTKAKEGWLEVKCLTFAPLEEILIDNDMLTEKELSYLNYFKKQFLEEYNG